MFANVFQAEKYFWRTERIFETFPLLMRPIYSIGMLSCQRLVAVI